MYIPGPNVMLEGVVGEDAAVTVGKSEVVMIICSDKIAIDVDATVVLANCWLYV